MRKISEKESDIANLLNEKRQNAYIDIYKENDFSGIGIIIDEELTVYEYLWNIGFNKENNSFSNNNIIYKCRNKINYEEIEKYLISDLNIIEKEYLDDCKEDENYSEIIKLKSYVNEFSNKYLYDKIKEKISTMIKEDL